MNAVQEIDSKLLELRSELFSFERNCSNVELARIWNHAWFITIKSVTETFFKVILRELEHELLGFFPPYFRELVALEVSKTFLNDFYRNLLPFLVDELNILRGITKDVRDSYSVFLETECVDCRVFVHVIFNYEFLGGKKVVKVGGKILIKVCRAS